MSMDGLAALNAKREKAKRQSVRHLPPPRHATSSVRDQDLSSGPHEARSGKADAANGRPFAPEGPHATPAATGTSPVAEDVPLQQQGTPLNDVLVRSTIYVRETDDAWLEGIAIGGRTKRPKVDASRSAVVRLALDRLRDEMSEDEIITHLENKARTSNQTVGRKRL